MVKRGSCSIFIKKLHFTHYKIDYTIEFNDTTAEKSSWNLSQMLITEIGELSKQGSHAFVSGNHIRAYEYLKAISMRITSYLSNEEYNTLLELERKLNICARGTKGSLGFIQPKERALAQTTLVKFLNEYNRTIFLYLKKYGLLIPPKTDKTEMRA